MYLIPEDNPIEVDVSLLSPVSILFTSPLLLSLLSVFTMAITVWSVLAILLFLHAAATGAVNSQIKVTDNPADKLVAAINQNRTAHKASSLHDNPGLACIALQYIKAYQGDCGAVGGADAKKPPESQFAETFAPSCGVKASTLATITGRFLGCQTKYVHAPEAFSEILIKNQRSLDILYSKNHTQVGAAVTGTDGGSPYFWCVLFSNGKPNSTFMFEDGVAKITKPGCFSGANDECSGAYGWSQLRGIWVFATAALAASSFALAL
ncbi:uncharacterized protein LOC114734062 [Neltuma alba]|uniref:uncharacterized protein LOC114734062 n=1 Tax=Neltuma alba TaxID=207710 RepID=UPI0010A4B83E|nr:uncharacterized protein LOC114734062 [Prosopis alba]